MTDYVLHCSMLSDPPKAPEPAPAQVAPETAPEQTAAPPAPQE